MKEDRIQENNNVNNTQFNELDGLDAFILQNRESFEEELPLGHIERFSKKVALNSGKTDKVRRLILSVSAIAAVAIIGLIAFTQINRAQNEDYEFLYYKAQMESVKNKILNESVQIGGATETEVRGTVYSIMNEAIPLEQLLPDELTKAQKDTILKKYYQKKLNGLNQYRSIVSQELHNNR